MEKEHQANAVRNALWSDIFHNDFQPCPATVTARDRDVEIQYYVESAADSSPALPDSGAVQRYFQRLCCGCVSVEDLGNAYLVTVGNYFRVAYTHESGLLCYEDLLEPAHKELHTVDGQKVLVYLVVPDVYGCEVIVRERQVQVSVGRDVIDRIIYDRGWRDSLLYQPLLEKSYIVSVGYASTGRMNVTYVSTKRKCRKWEWELFILQRLVKLLNPFTTSLPTDPLPVGDRRLDRCNRVLAGNVPACSDRHSDVVIRMDKTHFSIVNKERFFKKMRGNYPEVDFVCDPDQLTLKLSAKGGQGEKVSKDIWGHIRKVRREDIYLTDMQAMMMKNINAQSWFQQSLDDKAVDCFWELSESQTHSSEPRGPVISVTASESDIQKVAQAFQSCFPTKRVFLSKSQVPHLHSDEWKQIQDDLQRLYGKRIAPVLKVEQNKITICDTESNMDTTLRAVLEFFHERLVGSQQEFCEEVTEIITKLRPWQVRLLSKVGEKKQLPQCLQQTMSVEMDLQTVRIHAPVHMINRCLIVFWDHVTDLSQQMIALKTASAQRLQTADIQQRIQGLLDTESIVCDWQVEQGQLLISAHQSHLSQANFIFVSEIKAAELAFEPQIRQQDSKSQQTEDTEKETANRHQQTEEQSQRNREQQTVTIQKKNKQTQALVKTKPKTVQTEGGNVTVTASRTQIVGYHQHDREPPITETQETQTELCFQHREETLVNDNHDIANDKENTDQATDLENPAPVQTRADAGQTAQTHTTWKSQQSELEGRETDDEKYEDAREESSPPSSIQPVQQGSQELTEPSSDPQDNLHSSEGESEQSDPEHDPEQVLEEVPSMKSQVLVDSSQEDRGGSRMEPPLPWASEHCTELTQALQRTRDCLTLLLSHLSAHPHIPTGSFSDETVRKRALHDANTESPDFSDTATLSAHSNEDTTLFSSDQSLNIAEGQLITKDAISYPEMDGLNRTSDHEYNHSSRPRKRIPIKPHASDSESLSGSSELLSMNSINSSVASSRAEKDEGINRQLSSDSSSRAFSGESPAELQEEAQVSCYAHTQQPGCSRQPQNAGLSTSQLHVGLTPGLRRDRTGDGIVYDSEVQRRTYPRGYCPPERGFGNPDRHHFSAVHHARNETALYPHTNGSSTERYSNPQPDLCGSSEQQYHSDQAEETREKLTSFSSRRTEHQHGMTSSPAATSSSGNESRGSRRKRGSSSKNTPKGLQFQVNSATHARLTELERRVSQMDGERAQHPLTVHLESCVIAVQRQLCEMMQMLRDIRQGTL